MDDEALKNLVASGDLASYRHEPGPQDPQDTDDLLVLVFPSGRQLYISAFNVHSLGGLSVSETAP